jgi:internalin A
MQLRLEVNVTKKYKLPSWIENESAIFERVTSSRVESEIRLRNYLSKYDDRKKRDICFEGIYLVDTSLVDPPLEIAAQGADALVNYFEERQQGELPLAEAKVIFVGQGGSGKTSLVKQLFHERFNEFEPQTHGINIRAWELQTKADDSVTLNVWDFGGQEIMHATHQFFLSKRSLYILVLDRRKDEDPEHWLQLIESFGGDSPIIVVMK